jgi:hypothetical protein
MGAKLQQKSIKMMLADIKINSTLKSIKLQGDKKELQPKFKENLQSLHHHLALQPFVGFCLLSQVSPSSSILSCLLPVFNFQFFLVLP